MSAAKPSFDRDTFDRFLALLQESLERAHDDIKELRGQVDTLNARDPRIHLSIPQVVTLVGSIIGAAALIIIPWVTLNSSVAAMDKSFSSNAQSNLVRLIAVESKFSDHEKLSGHPVALKQIEIIERRITQVESELHDRGKK